MSGLPPETSRSTRQDAPQVAEGLPKAPFDMVRGTALPTTYSFPGPLQPPVSLLPNSTFCTMSSFAMDLTRPMNNPNLRTQAILNNALLRNATSVATLQLSRSTGYIEPPAIVRFQPPLTNMRPEPPSTSDLQQGQQSLQAAQQGLSVNKPPKEPGQVRRKGRRSDKGRRVAHVAAAAVHVQSDQTNSQVCPGQNQLQGTRHDDAVGRPSEQPGRVHRTDRQPDEDSRVTDVAPALDLQSDQTNNQIDRRQNHLQTVQRDNVGEELSKEPGKVDRNDHQSDKDPRATPAVYLQSDETNILLHPLERDFSVHTCSNNPESACARSGTVCLDAFYTFIREYSVTLSSEQIAEYVFAAMFPEHVGEEQPVNQPAQVDATDATSSSNTNTPSSWGITSPSSSTVVSSPAAVYSSPTGSSLSALEQLQAAGSPSTSSTSCSVRKRPQLADCSEERPQKRQRMECADAASDDHREACNVEILDCTKESGPPEEKYEYICRICMIHAKAVTPLPCKDELRCHIESMHEPFLVLVDHERFNILKPQRSDRYENLVPLIRFCIPLQLRAQQRGVVIPPDRDLTILYPYIAAFLYHR